MRPAYLRQESPMMRRLRQADLDAQRIRAVDLLALALGYGLLLSMSVAGLIAVVDAIQGNPQTVLPQLAALIARMD